MKVWFPLLLATAVALISGCASVPTDPVARAEFKANNDPLEPLNRRIFAANLFVDKVLIKPVALGYRHAIPQPGRDAIHRFLMNLDEPLIMVNEILQGRFADATTTADRVIINTTFGFAGFVDVASKNNAPKKKADFGQTLYVWGIHEGPFLMIPLFGPSNPRDGLGIGADIYLDPIRYVARANHYPTAFSTGRTVVNGIDLRERNIETMDELQHEAVDFYASLRSLYRQNRAAELNNGKVSTTPPAGFYDDPGK